MRLHNIISIATLLLPLLLVAGRLPAQEHTTGAVIESIAADSAAGKAGLLAGDMLQSWTRGDTKGPIESPFDVSWIEVEQAPRGQVTLEGVRGAQRQSWKISSGDWGLRTRPNFSPALQANYQQGADLAKTGKLTEASEQWHAAAGKIDNTSPSWLRLWFLAHAAETLAEARQWKEADTAYEELISQSAQVQPGIKPEVKEELLRTWARSFEQRADWPNAEKHYQEEADEIQKRNVENLLLADALDGVGAAASELSDLAKSESCYSQALAIQQKLAPASLNLAKSLNGLGLIARRRGDLAKAEDYFRQALTIRENLAPGSLDAAASMTSLGSVAWLRGDLAKAEDYFRQALAIREKFSPGSLDVARSLNNLGIVADSRGNLGDAEKYFRQALDIKQKLAPGSSDVVGSLNNLGKVTWSRGDLLHAEEFYRQALAMEEKRSAESLNMAAILVNLGLVAENRGDLVKAEEYESRGLAIRQKLAPNSLDVAQSFNNLGNVAWNSGNLLKAEEYYLQDLAIREKLAPETLDVAASLSNLGTVARNLGDLAKAEQYHRHSLAIEEKLAPGSLTVGESLASLGDIARDRGDLTGAEELYRRALAIQEKLAPEKKNYAEVLANLAGIMLRKGELDAAAPLFAQALNALEGQTAHLGGTEDVRSNFRAKYLNYYQDYIDLLVHQGKPELAFQVLERSRARSLLEMLTDGHVEIRKGIDTTLLEQKRSLQADLSAKQNRRIQLLSGKHTGEQIMALNEEIDKLLAQYKDLEEEIRVSSPGYAALIQPQPLNTQQAQQLLDDDTLLLAYSLGDEHSYLFALTRDSIWAYPLPQRIVIEALAFGAYKELSVNNPSADDQSTVALSKTLLTPIAEHLNKKRLVIVADGALQYLPFAALLTSQGTRLIAGHEIVNLPSASTLAVLRKEIATRTPAPNQIAVLADPVFDNDDERLKSPADGDPNPKAKNSPKNAPSPNLASFAASAEDSGDRLTRSAADLGMTTKGTLYLPRLPNTRLEAQGILAAASAEKSLEALDFDASRATAINPALGQYRIVHFATHGLLNNTHPELSGLVLSLVNQQAKPENGFLDLHDIYNLNLPADLVVLSACETGLGQQIQGEGLVGMTRAFMYAGAPRVVASLWRVPDRATAELMKQFYAAMLGEGLPPAAALRKAQLNVSKEKRWSAPYFWAAFTLQGEWR